MFLQEMVISSPEQSATSTLSQEYSPEDTNAMNLFGEERVFQCNMRNIDNSRITTFGYSRNGSSKFLAWSTLGVKILGLVGSKIGYSRFGRFGIGHFQNGRSMIGTSTNGVYRPTATKQDGVSRTLATR
jgi:hypothetical protein